MSERGLADERTVISWTRTALLAAALGILLLRLGVAHRSPVEIAAAVAAFVTAVVLGVGRRRSGHHGGAAYLPIRIVAGGACLVGLLAVAGAVL